MWRKKHKDKCTTGFKGNKTILVQDMGSEKTKIKKKKMDRLYEKNYTALEVFMVEQKHIPGLTERNTQESIKFENTNHDGIHGF